MPKFVIEVDVPEDSLPSNKIDRLFHVDNCMKVALDEFVNLNGDLEGASVHNTMIVDKFDDE